MKKKRLALSCYKKLLGLLKRITSKNNRYFYCLSCLHSLRADDKRKSQEKLYKNKDFSEFFLPIPKNNMLAFNQYMKSNEMPYTIHADIEFLIKKADNCKNNAESSIAKIGKHVPCEYSM